MVTTMGNVPAPLPGFWTTMRFGVPLTTLAVSPLTKPVILYVRLGIAAP